jgi:hypothetical protein
MASTRPPNTLDMGFNGNLTLFSTRFTTDTLKESELAAQPRHPHAAPASLRNALLRLPGRIRIYQRHSRQIQAGHGRKNYQTTETPADIIAVRFRAANPVFHAFNKHDSEAAQASTKPINLDLIRKMQTPCTKAITGGHEGLAKKLEFGE